VTEPGYQPIDASLLGAEHVRRYQETDGEVGYIWNGATTLLLSTVGRKSGQRRTTPLIFARDGKDFLVVASVGGAPKHPAWYLNLESNAEAEIQVLGERIKVLARSAGDGEKARLWNIVCEQWPNYNVYQSRTERVIPLVVLSPAVADGSG
jgi:deazaflavin-dependent oxidoreductase (nitroreductase family)